MTSRPTLTPVPSPPERTTAGGLYIVELIDHCTEALAGHPGRVYTAPAQPLAEAHALICALLGCPQQPLSNPNGPWLAPVAGGQRIIHLRAAAPVTQVPADPGVSPARPPQ